MTVESSWEERNGEFLSAALHWLRTLLGRYVEAAEPGSAAMTMPSVTERSIVVAVFAAGKTPVAVVVRVTMVHR